MSSEEFITSFGPPSNAIDAETAAVDASRGRVPDDLVEFWKRHGWGSYAKGRYWLCKPELFTPFLGTIFRKIDDFSGNDVSAFSYSYLGNVNIWYRAGRLFSYSIPTRILTDETSFQQTVEVPYDVEDLMALAGVPAELAREAFLAGRPTKEDIWMTISNGAMSDKSDYDRTDSGKSLFRELIKAYGALKYGEIYLRNMSKPDNEATSYRKISIAEAIIEIPEKITYISYSNIDDKQIQNKKEITVK